MLKIIFLLIFLGAIDLFFVARYGLFPSIAFAAISLGIIHDRGSHWFQQQDDWEDFGKEIYKKSQSKKLEKYKNS